MTAINVFATADAVHLFTDGAIYDSTDARVIGFGSEVALAPLKPRGDLVDLFRRAA